MPVVQILTDPDHWRNRAKETRTLAEQMNDPVARQMMLNVAKDYEKLAVRASLRVIDNRKAS